LLTAGIVALRVPRIPGADNQVFQWTIGNPQPRREQVLLHFDAAIVIVWTDAADEKTVGVEVVYLDAGSARRGSE
jgi:hypothetical protein